MPHTGSEHFALFLPYNNPEILNSMLQGLSFVVFVFVCDITIAPITCTGQVLIPILFHSPEAV